MEMVLNTTMFEPLAFDEMLYIDGGAWKARHWVAAGLIVVGSGCAVVGIYCPGLWGISAKTWAAAGVIITGSGGILAIG